MNDIVNHPSHYTDGKIEVIDFIEDKPTKINAQSKQAVKEFAERVKEKAKNLKLGSVEVHNFLCVNDIDETLKEFIKD